MHHGKRLAALEDIGSGSGDANLQERLVDIVRLQIGQEKVKESVEEEKEKLQKVAEEVSFLDLCQA
jgi:hypothetical protein